MFQKCWVLISHVVLTTIDLHTCGDGDSFSSNSTSVSTSIHRIFLYVYHFLCAASFYTDISSGRCTRIRIGRTSLRRSKFSRLIFVALSASPLTLGVGYVEYFRFIGTCSTLSCAFTLLLSMLRVHIPRHFPQTHIFRSFTRDYHYSRFCHRY